MRRYGCVGALLRGRRTKISKRANTASDCNGLTSGCYQPGHIISVQSFSSKFPSAFIEEIPFDARKPCRPESRSVALTRDDPPKGQASCLLLSRRSIPGIRRPQAARISQPTAELAPIRVSQTGGIPEPCMVRRGPNAETRKQPAAVAVWFGAERA